MTRGFPLYVVALRLADVSVVVAFVVAWAFASPVASAVAGHRLATSASERVIESIADAGCFMVRPEKKLLDEASNDSNWFIRWHVEND